jgi:thiol-disulfide isomerase/thioredoxin
MAARSRFGDRHLPSIPMHKLVAMRRSLIPVLIIVCAFVALPPLLNKVFPRKLPVAQLLVHSIPHRLTEFTFSDDSGRSLTLYRFRGSVVLVNVWATWCPPCKEEMASLDHLALLFAKKRPENCPYFDRRFWSSRGALFLQEVRLK